MFEMSNVFETFNCTFLVCLSVYLQFAISCLRKLSKYYNLFNEVLDFID